MNCDNTNRACGGGNIVNSFKWVQENGVIPQNESPYKAVKQSCDRSLKSKEIKVLSGFASYHDNKPKEEWYRLLSRGPMVVVMDATSEGFGNYRPKGDFDWEPGTCNVNNHFVVAVGFEEDEKNGLGYLRMRNSWGPF